MHRNMQKNVTDKAHLACTKIVYILLSFERTRIVRGDLKSPAGNVGCKGVYNAIKSAKSGYNTPTGKKVLNLKSKFLRKRACSSDG